MDRAKLAERLLRENFGTLPEREQRILDRLAQKKPISRDLSREEGSLGDRVADRVASFGGSWAFILLFSGLLALWILGNTVLAARAPDPFPFIFLNLLLSMIAAFQAPVIMMSQNRQAAKDRAAAAHDYEVNLKAELEIMALHEKIDDIRTRQLIAHFAQVEERLAAIESRLSPGTATGGKPDAGV